MLISDFILTVSLLIVNVSVLGSRNKRSIEKCQSGQYPSQVCVLYFKSHQLCGGSIINLRYVLTSSYCFRDSPRRRNLNKFVLAGDLTWGHVISPHSQTRNITALIQYPGSYRTGFDLDDVALLKVDPSFDENFLVAPIELSTETPSIGVRCTLLGWGQPGLTRKTTHLRRGYVYIQRQIKCGGNFITDVDRIICGANSDTTHTPCIVDIGGPLICDYKLAGIHTRANHDCDNNTYGRYFMNVAYYRNWILRMIEWEGFGNVPEPRSAPIRDYRNEAFNSMSVKFLDYVIIYLIKVFINYH